MCWGRSRRRWGDCRAPRRGATVLRNPRSRGHPVAGQRADLAEAEHITQPQRRRAGRFHLRRNRPSSAHVEDAVRPSPARAQPHDATAWLPLPAPESLPHVDDLLTPDAPAETATPSPTGAPASPARAAPHDETSWLPLPELEDLPSIHELLTPDPEVDAPPALPVATPSPARAEPHDATTWLPLPEVEALPEVDADGATAGRGSKRGHGRRRRFHVPVRSLLVIAVIMGTIGGVAWAGGQALDPGDDVTLRVDGRTVDAETGVSTVGSFLSEQKVDLAADDRVVPDADTPIENGMSVRVVRAFPVSVDFDGQQMTIYTTWHDPEAFVKNLRLGSGKVGFRDPQRVPITEDATVILRTKKIGTLFLDGQAIAYQSPSYNVAELLERYEVTLGPLDTTTPALGEVVPERGSVTVTRVDTLTEFVDEPYTLPDEVQPDPNLEVGKTREEAAVTGLQRVTYQVIQHDGAESERIPISKVPINPAKPHIAFYGTHYNPLWDKMAQCETGGNWAATGQRYQGGLGIYYMNWSHYGGLDFAPTAGQATKLEQIIVAERIREEHGWRAWGCAKRIGL